MERLENRLTFDKMLLDKFRPFENRLVVRRNSRLRSKSETKIIFRRTSDENPGEKLSTNWLPRSSIFHPFIELSPPLFLSSSIIHNK